MYLGATSSIVTVLRTRHLLGVRELANTDPTRIRERRLDIRRSPYRKAYLTRSSVWCDTYMNDGTQTLVMPLVERARVIGFWMISFASREEVTRSQLSLAETLARELMRSIERPRDRGARRALDQPARYREIDSIRRSFEVAAQDRHDFARLGEMLPYPMFVVTVFGELRYANTAMRLTCAARGIDLDRTDLLAMLDDLTRRGTTETLEGIRELAHLACPLHLQGDGGGVTLAWFGGAEDPERLLLGWLAPSRSSIGVVDECNATTPRLPIVCSPELLPDATFTMPAFDDEHTTPGATAYGPSGTLRTVMHTCAGA
jgi:hypothetical protein